MPYTEKELDELAKKSSKSQWDVIGNPKIRSEAKAVERASKKFYDENGNPKPGYTISKERSAMKKAWKSADKAWETKKKANKRYGNRRIYDAYNKAVMED